jgi:glycerol-3-phosphate dehydrogenase
MTLTAKNPAIPRNPHAAAQQTYDLIVIGGGIYGVAATLQAARRGLRTLLLEKTDFGHATSFASLRIVHGGLRYLQNLELHRFRQSVAERKWWLQTFPDLVRPLRCIMPLYGQGLRRPSIMRAALALNDALSFTRNRNLPPSQHLPPSRILSPTETANFFPAVDPRNLKAAALWHDGLMLSSERLLLELLRWACACGATALNYLQADSLITHHDTVTAVQATDLTTQTAHHFHAPVVLNCAGPWCRDLAQRFHHDVPTLFRKSLAFNLLLDRPAPADAALAVAPRTKNARTYFLVPWKGKLLAGTYHMTYAGSPDNPTPPDPDVDAFLNDLNTAIPNFDASRDQILRIYAGLLPAIAPDNPNMAHKSILYDHHRHAGPAGCFTLSGVKYTTARLVADHAITRIFPHKARPLTADTLGPAPNQHAHLTDITALLHRDDAALLDLLQHLASDESALHVDDLILRRMDGAYTPRDIAALTALASRALSLAHPQSTTAR